MNDLPDAHDRADDAERDLAYLESALDKATASELQFMARTSKAEAEVRRLTIKLNTIRNMLDSIQWNGFGTNQCPACSFDRKEGHAHNCRIKAALG